MSAERTSSDLPVVAITAGEPAGIGPDLCVALAGQDMPARIVVIADRGLLAARACALGVALVCRDFTPGNRAGSGARELEILHVPLAVPAVPGVLNRANSAYVLRTLEIAADGCSAGTFGAMCTAPVQKSVINDAGYAFTGHTEFLAEHCASSQVVMMLVGGGMRVALATTHLPLKDVAANISREKLLSILRVLHAGLVRHFGIEKPHILVAGLNPHAGESGHLGREEMDVIIPAIAALQNEGYDLAGPLPADTLFHPDRLRRCDCVLAMYHDQGLPVLKHASFGSAVNITLGLPILRTSVDHGTALELAGTGRAEAGSLIQAVQLAAQLAHRKSTSPS